jgi:hypothetical protein
MNFFLEQGSLTSLCWLDMLDAGTYVMNRLPHPQSRVPERQKCSAHELAYGRKPDLSDLIAAPGELVVIDWIGTKASAGAQTGEQGYYVLPVGAGHMVRTFKNLMTVVTKSVRRLTNSPEYARSLARVASSRYSGGALSRRVRSGRRTGGCGGQWVSLPPRGRDPSGRE